MACCGIATRARAGSAALLDKAGIRKTGKNMDRRSLMTGMAAMAASAWVPQNAFALGLPKDRIKRIRYYKTPTDAAGRPNIHQPTFNQSTNVVTIETEGGLIGVG